MRNSLWMLSYGVIFKFFPVNNITDAIHLSSMIEMEHISQFGLKIFVSSSSITLLPSGMLQISQQLKKILAIIGDVSFPGQGINFSMSCCTS